MVLARGVRAGVIAAAATAGALVAFGHAHGATLRPINAVAHVLLGSRALLFDEFDPVVTIAGLIVHVISLAIWGVIFAVLARPLRGAALLLAGVVFAALAYLADYAILPAQLRPGFENVISRAEIIIVYVVLGVSIAVGLKLARDADDIPGVE
jgi:hypothetical protein